MNENKSQAVDTASASTVSDDKVKEVSDEIIKNNIEAYKELAK